MASDEDSARVTDERLFDESQVAGEPEVVGVEEGDHVAPSPANAYVPGGGDTGVVLSQHGHGAAVGGGDRLRCPIGGPVVHNDDLVWRATLIARALDGLKDTIPTLVCRDHHGDGQGRGGRTHHREQ